MLGFAKKIYNALFNRQTQPSASPDSAPIFPTASASPDPAPIVPAASASTGSTPIVPAASASTGSTPIVPAVSVTDMSTPSLIEPDPLPASSYGHEDDSSSIARASASLGEVEILFPPLSVEDTTDRDTLLSSPPAVVPFADPPLVPEYLRGAEDDAAGVDFVSYRRELAERRRLAEEQQHGDQQSSSEALGHLPRLRTLPLRRRPRPRISDASDISGTGSESARVIDHTSTAPATSVPKATTGKVLAPATSVPKATTGKVLAPATSAPKVTTGKDKEQISLDYAKKIEINFKKKDGVGKYFWHLQTATDKIDKRKSIDFSFKKIVVNNNAQEKLNTDLNFFDLNTKDSKVRTFYSVAGDGDEDDSMLQYQKQLALRLSIHSKLFEKFSSNKSLSKQELIDMAVDFRYHTNIGDIDLKICELLEKIYENSNPNSLQLSDCAFIGEAILYKQYLEKRLKRGFIDVDKSADLKLKYDRRFFDLLNQIDGNQTVPLADELNKTSQNVQSFYLKAKKMMQNEAIKKGKDAEFLKYDFQNELTGNFKVLNREISDKETEKQKFRVTFTRLKKSAEARVRVEISGRFDAKMDAITVCLDGGKNIYRQFLLKNENNIPKIESSFYIMEIEGKMRELSAKKVAGQIKYFYHDDKQRELELSKYNAKILKEVLQKEQISLKLNKENYIFKANQGLKIKDDKIKTENLEVNFDDYLAENNKEKQVAIFELKNSDDKNGNFKRKKEFSEIRINSNNFGVCENYKIGYVINNKCYFNLHLVKINNEDNYKLYLRDLHGEYFEYKYDGKKDNIKLGESNDNPIISSDSSILKNIFELKIEFDNKVKNVRLEFTKNNLSITDNVANKKLAIGVNPSNTPRVIELVSRSPAPVPTSVATV